jgi:hypothetical protein
VAVVVVTLAGGGVSIAHWVEGPHGADHPACSPNACVTNSASPPEPSISMAASRCPIGVDPISPSSAGVFSAVTLFAATLDPTHLEHLVREQILLAATDKERGGQVEAECGTPVAARTLIVYARAADVSQGLSAGEHIYFVSKVRGRITVWEQAH